MWRQIGLMRYWIIAHSVQRGVSGSVFSGWVTSPPSLWKNCSKGYSQAPQVRNLRMVSLLTSFFFKQFLSGAHPGELFDCCVRPILLLNVWEVRSGKGSVPLDHGSYGIHGYLQPMYGNIFLCLHYRARECGILYIITYHHLEDRLVQC